MIAWSATAFAFDHEHAAFTAVLDGAVSASGVDYALLAARRPALQAYLDTLATADPTGFTRDQRLAFAIDAYNAHTLAIVLDAGPPASIRDLDGGKVWDTRRVVVAGAEVTLNQLENQQARALGDGRVHALLNCASKGCPPLAPRAVTAAGLAGQLDEGARRWASTNAFRVDGTTLRLSRIFDWYGEDFADEGNGDLPGIDGRAEDAVWFLSRYVDPATKALLVSGTLTVDWLEYDWALNRE